MEESPETLIRAYEEIIKRLIQQNKELKNCMRKARLITPKDLVQYRKTWRPINELLIKQSRYKQATDTLQ